MANQSLGERLAELRRRINLGDTVAEEKLNAILAIPFQKPWEEGRMITIFPYQEALERIRKSKNILMSPAIEEFVIRHGSALLTGGNAHAKVWEPPQDFGYKTLREYLDEIEEKHHQCTIELFLSSILEAPEWVPTEKRKRLYAGMDPLYKGPKSGVLYAVRSQKTNIRISLTWGMRVAQRLDPRMHQYWLVRV